MLFECKINERMIPIKNYATVSADASLREAALSLRTSYCELEEGMCTEAGPRTALVLDRNTKLVGILDFRCFLEALIPEITGGLSAKLAALLVPQPPIAKSTSSMCIFEPRGTQSPFLVANFSSSTISNFRLLMKISRVAEPKVIMLYMFSRQKR